MLQQVNMLCCIPFVAASLSSDSGGVATGVWVERFDLCCVGPNWTGLNNNGKATANKRAVRKEYKFTHVEHNVLIHKWLVVIWPDRKLSVGVAIGEIWFLKSIIVMMMITNSYWVRGSGERTTTTGMIKGKFEYLPTYLTSYKPL